MLLVEPFLLCLTLYTYSLNIKGRSEERHSMKLTAYQITAARRKNEDCTIEQKVILSLCSGETPPRVLCSTLGPQHKKDRNLLKQVQRRAMKMIRGQQHLSYADRLRVGVVQPREGKGLGTPYSSLQYLKGDLQETWGGTLCQGVE